MDIQTAGEYESCFFLTFVMDICACMKKLIVFLLCFAGYLLVSSYDSNPADLIDRMIEKNKTIKTLSVDVTIKERIKDKTINKFNHFTLQVDPYKVYFTESKFGIDLEGLFVAGAYNNQARIATVGFPWIKLDLDPMGSKMRNETHHTIYEAGFGYFINVVSHFKSKYGDKFSDMMTYQGLFMKGQVYFYKIVLDNPNFKYSEYTVKKGENLNTIAKKIWVNDYMILEKNPALADFNDVKEGQKIIVPSDYAKKMVFHLDKTLMLPLYVELYDDKGFYASYSFSNIQINPQLDKSVFDYTNPKYHFN